MVVVELEKKVDMIPAAAAAAVAAGPTITLEHSFSPLVLDASS